jgi:diguanylate cyclase (GGDEF)-like protein/PAS domain S-box-containing protein
MSNVAQNDSQPDLTTFQSEATTSHRSRAIRVLFIQRDRGVVDDCQQELTKARFVVSADVFLTLEQGVEQIRSQAYDVVVAEYPGPSPQESEALQLLCQTAGEVPLLFVTTAMSNEFLAQRIADGAFDYVEREHLGQLSMAVRRALKERQLREELEEAGKALQHSQSLYRSLVDNPDYGICRCDAGGKIQDVNQAFLTMLGYSTKGELLAANGASEIVLDLGHAKPVAESSPESLRIEPVEIELKRKNGTTLKARLGGHAIFDEGGNFVGHEVISVDITEQRALEDHLRRQALSDSLTGLANHRRLFEVLHAEIARWERTKREFSLLLLDLDRLKAINDRFGHSVGSKALCRLAQIMTDCCRSIDTAARQSGDEFALVLPETSGATAALVASRICTLLSKDAQVPPLSVSVGVATYPKDAKTIGGLLQVADRALYRMKKEKQYARAARAGQC